MAHLRLIESAALEAPVAEAEGLAEVIDMAEFVRQRNELLALVNIVAVGDEPEGRAWVRSVAIADSYRFPERVSAMLEATRAAVGRQTVWREHQALEQKLLGRAAWLDLPDHWLRTLGIKPDLTVEQAYDRVETDLSRRRRGLPSDTILRNFGRGVVNFAKERGLL